MSEQPYFKLTRPSKRSGKKWKIRVPTKSGRGFTVVFGDAKMEDYTIHKNKDRRENYRNRHRNDKINNPYMPGFWSWYALWGESSDLKVALADAVRRAKKIVAGKNAERLEAHARHRNNPEKEEASKKSFKDKVKSFLTPDNVREILAGTLDVVETMGPIIGPAVLAAVGSVAAPGPGTAAGAQAGLLAGIAVSKVAARARKAVEKGAVDDLARKNPNPPGTPSPTMAEVAEVIAVLDVPVHLRAAFIQGFAAEWEHVHTVGYDMLAIGNIVLDHLAEDENYYRKLRRARLNPSSEMSPSNRVQSCFDALLSSVQEQYPSLRCTIEVDESAGERGGEACTRAYAFCEDLEDGSFRIAVAGKMNDADDSRIEGLLQHELAHAVLLHTGDLEHTERDADEIAEALFGLPIYYDEDDVQTTDPSAPGARKPRPPYLDDENGRTLDSAEPESEYRENSEGSMRLETVEDVAMFLDDCAATGDAKAPRMIASQLSQQAQQVAGAQARMLLVLARAARHRANAIEARLAGNIESAIASENLSERALAEAESGPRQNPEWARKLGKGLYKGATYAQEAARDIGKGVREGFAERKNPGCPACRANGRHNPRCMHPQHRENPRRRRANPGGFKIEGFSKRDKAWKDFRGEDGKVMRFDSAHEAEVMIRDLVDEQLVESKHKDYKGFRASRVY